MIPSKLALLLQLPHLTGLHACKILWPDEGPFSAKICVARANLELAAPGGVVVAFATALFPITNPTGNTAAFASMTGARITGEQIATARQSALETSGGLIVLILGLSMLNSEPSKQANSDAGPGAITTVLVSAGKQTANC